MIRMLFGMLIGAALTVVLVFGNLIPRNANGQDVQSESNITEQDLIGPVRESMLSPLQKTVNETANTASGQFLSKLVQEYDLEKLPGSNQKGAGLVDIVPDFVSINQKAINLPLAEAGKTIRDKEIAAFYFDYLKRSGFNVTPGGGEAP